MMPMPEAHTSPEADVANLRAELDACRAEISSQRAEIAREHLREMARQKVDAALDLLAYGKAGRVTREEVDDGLRALLGAALVHLGPTA